jgi:ribonuclease HII
VNKQEREERQRQKLWEMTAYERALRAQGAAYIAGVDEVGRGPLAGPVLAAAVILPADFAVLGVDDSKKLSAKRREALFDVLRETAVAWGFGQVDNKGIDEMNILAATRKAMKQAVDAAASMLAARAGGGDDPSRRGIGHVLIDALTLPDLRLPQTGIVKGDEKSVSIAAASILAKVTRDRIMLAFHAQYPAYRFDKNKGYGTREHYAGIRAAGLCPIHRLCFCRSAPARTEQ